MALGRTLTAMEAEPATCGAARSNPVVLATAVAATLAMPAVAGAAMVTEIGLVYPLPPLVTGTLTKPP